jgi:hypothetical protein
VALKPDGKSARTERVTFTRPAAERIAQVVRTVEQGDRDSAGLRFPRPIGAGGGEPKAFRICTFTGAWAIDTLKTVTFYQQSVTPNTLSVSNLILPVPQLSDNTATPTICCVGRDGASWYLINVRHSDHTVVTGAALTPTRIEFARKVVAAVGRTMATSSIAVASCSTT